MLTRRYRGWGALIGAAGDERREFGGHQARVNKAALPRDTKWGSGHAIPKRAGSAPARTRGAEARLARGADLKRPARRRRGRSGQTDRRERMREWRRRRERYGGAAKQAADRSRRVDSPQRSAVGGRVRAVIGGEGTTHSRSEQFVLVEYRSPDRHLVTKVLSHFGIDRISRSRLSRLNATHL
jgi:hypothetical protein